LRAATGNFCRAKAADSAAPRRLATDFAGCGRAAAGNSLAISAI
jgi:hypothetical protein